MENLWNFPKGIFQRNGYLTLFIDKCFEKFLDRLHIIKTTIETVKNKSLGLILTYLGPISLQVRTEIRNAMKGTLNCCKLQVTFSEIKLSKACKFVSSKPKSCPKLGFFHFLRFGSLAFL